MPSCLSATRVRRAWRAWAGALLLASLAPCTVAQDAPTQVRITEALAVESSGPQFPVDQSSAAVSLPHHWIDRHLELPVHMWYRLRFDRPAGVSADAVLGVAIPRVCSTFALRLNGRAVLDRGVRDDHHANLCHRPQLVALPVAGLRERGNLLDIQVSGWPLRSVPAREREGGLSDVVVGAYAQLEPAQARSIFWRIDAVRTINGVLGTLAVLLLTLAFLRRRDPPPYYLGMAALLWALLSARVWTEQLPLPTGVWIFVSMPAMALGLTLAVQFLLSYAGLRSRAIEAALAVQCVMVPLSQWLAGPHLLFPLARAWQMLLLIELAAAVALYLRTTAGQGRRDFAGMAALVLAVLALLAAEAAVQNAWLPTPPVSLLHLLLPVLAIALVLRLMWAFVYALRAAEADRTALEARVREAAGEIERKFQQLAEARVEQVTVRERKRIAADLHDDLGAKLLTIVHTSESDRISTLAREALEEMRLSVRGLTGRPMRLGDALADWRSETVSRLGQANVEIDWKSPVEETDVELPARSYVQTTRIIREAVSNIIKHSGASHCKVRCAVTEDAFGINIQDNGNGIPMELDGKLDRGHGMSSMKGRAKQMQGQCLVESGPGYGTVIRLTLPLRPGAPVP